MAGGHPFEARRPALLVALAALVAHSLAEPVPPAAVDASTEAEARQLWGLFGGGGGGAPQTAETKQVTVEVYYKWNCPHCLDFVHGGLLPLVEAGLPGDRVKVTALPYLETGRPTSREDCMARPDCHDVMASLCSLHGAGLLPEPVPANTPKLLPSLRFSACVLDKTAGEGGTNDAQSLQACAEKANVPWAGSDGVEACMAGQEAFNLMMDFNNYANNILAVVGRFKEQGFSSHVGVPWIFVNEEMLACNGDMCFARKTPDSTENLGQPGSLLFLVCSKLDPAPEQCQGVHGAHGATVKPTPACENCAEVGSFRYRAPRAAAPALAPLSLGGLLLVALAALGAVAWRRSQHLAAETSLQAGVTAAE